MPFTSSRSSRFKVHIPMHTAVVQLPCDQIEKARLLIQAYKASLPESLVHLLNQIEKSFPKEEQ